MNDLLLGRMKQLAGKREKAHWTDTSVKISESNDNGKSSKTKPDNDVRMEELRYKKLKYK